MEKLAKIFGIMCLAILISGCEATEQKICETSGGKWNECGSSCAGTDAEFCIQVCKAQCECNEEYTCPDGNTCKITEKEKFGVCSEE